MDYTENYRLSQWAAEDRILREDFNRDNASVESGLTTLQKGLTAETQNREAAVAAARQEASQALSTAAGALESGKADKTALSQLQALVDAMPFVRLRNITVSQAVNQVDVDMTGISLSQYSYLIIVPRLWVNGKTSVANFYMRINGLADGSYRAIGGSQDYLFTCGSMGAETFQRVELSEVDGRIKAVTYRIDDNGSTYMSGSGVKEEVLQADQVQTVNFVGNSGELILQGGQIQIYGVKR